MDTAELLAPYAPCDDARAWLGTRDPETAWHECQRGDWMLWALSRIGLPRPLLVLAACDCAETALEHTDDSDVWMVSLLDAAYAAAVYAANAANAANAYRASLARSADLVRARVPWTVVAALIRQALGSR